MVYYRAMLQGSLPEEKSGGSKRSSLIRLGLVFTILALYFILLLGSANRISMVSDEPFHISRGASALFSGDFRMSVAHPPLINLASALPLLFFDELRLPFNDVSWRSPDMPAGYRKSKFSKLFLWILNPDPRAIIFWCRIPIMLMSLVLGFLVYFSAQKLFGEAAGFAALLLYCGSPTIIAHSRVSTTDLGCALFFMLFAMCLAWHLKTPSWKSLAVCGAVYGLAQLSKFTAILLMPLIPVIFLLCKQGSALARIKGMFALDPREKDFLTGFGGWASILMVGALVIWAGYGFETKTIHKFEDRHFKPFFDSPGLFVKTLSAKTLENVPLPPRTYYYGLAKTIMRTHRHSHPLYFLGKISEKGSWYYYPLLFLMKEPLAFLALLALSIIAWQRPGAEVRAAYVTGAVMVIGVLFFFMFLSNLNLGIRHVLPIYPFLIVYISRLVSLKKWGGYLAVAAWALIALHVGNALYSYPYYVAHFNSAVGGEEGGLRYSIVGEDWGQDIKDLGKYCKEHEINSIYYRPHANQDPAAFGIPYIKFDCEPMGPGWHALHLGDLMRPKRGQDPACYSFFRGRTPDAVVNYRIYLYNIRPEEITSAPKGLLPGDDEDE